MTLTFIDLYNECAGQPWSMFDAEAESIDDFETAMKISINKAISYLWNSQLWSFRKRTYTLTTKVGRSEYVLPDGIILNKTINGVKKYAVKLNGKSLDYFADYDLLDEREGSPEGFYVDGESLYIYPTPNSVERITVTYYALPYGLDEDENDLYELKEQNDSINIPEKYETLFKNCVISLAMIYAIADETDENHAGYVKQYEDALGVLIKYCKNGIKDRDIVW